MKGVNKISGLAFGLVGLCACSSGLTQEPISPSESAKNSGALDAKQVKVAPSLVSAVPSAPPRDTDPTRHPATTDEAEPAPEEHLFPPLKECLRFAAEGGGAVLACREEARRDGIYYHRVRIYQGEPDVPSEMRSQGEVLLEFSDEANGRCGFGVLPRAEESNWSFADRIISVTKEGAPGKAAILVELQVARRHPTAAYRRLCEAWERLKILANPRYVDTAPGLYPLGRRLRLEFQGGRFLPDRATERIIHELQETSGAQGVDLCRPARVARSTLPLGS